MSSVRSSRMINLCAALLAVAALTIGTFGFAPARAQAEPIPIGIAVAQTSDTALLGQEQVVGA